MTNKKVSVRNVNNYAKTIALGLFTAFSIQTEATGQTLEELSNVVVYIQQEKPITKAEVKPLEYGTGFLVTRNGMLFLVTAEHVANLMTANATVTIRSADDQPLTFLLQDLWNRAEALEWAKHGLADVAVLRISPKEQILPSLKKHFIPFEAVVRQEEAPIREKNLAVLGFPLQLGIAERFSPISQETKASSGLLRFPRFDTKVLSTFFILDRPSVGGFSGAPVFQMPTPYTQGNSIIVEGGFAKCVGLIHGTLGDKTGGKFAAVVPSVFIAQTIELAAK